MYRIGWFSTGRDQAARDLLQTVCHVIERGGLKVEFTFVFSNRERGESAESDKFLALVKSYALPLVSLSAQRYKGPPNWRLSFDREAMRLLSPFTPDLCVLAGYMLIVGPEMCHRYNMINLHPAAPGGPAGTWQEVIWQLIAARAEHSGVMTHLVTPELDKGPPVTYCTFSLRGELFNRYWKEIEGQSLVELKASQEEHNALFCLIRKEGLKREFPLIVATLKAFSEGRVRIEGGRVVTARGEGVGGYNLTEEIAKIIAEKA